MQQLDIFRDTRATQLVSDAVTALLESDGPRAAFAVEELRTEDTGHAALPALEILCRFIVSPQWDAMSVAQAVAWLKAEVVPASQVLGDHSEPFLRFRWREVAGRAAGAPYDPACPEAHTAALLLHAGDYAEADAAASRVCGGSDLPDVVRWRCIARHRLAGLDEALPLMLRFAWLSPDGFAALVGELGDPLVDRAWRGFSAALGDLDATWFPAWFLHEHPETLLPSDGVPEQVPGAAVYTVLAGLQALEKRGHSAALVSQRARLKSLGETFYDFYLRRRNGGKH